MLELKHVHILQDKDLKVLLEDLCLTVNPGEKAAIIGEEGNGKRLSDRLKCRGKAARNSAL